MDEGASHGATESSLRSHARSLDRNDVGIVKRAVEHPGRLFAVAFHPKISLIATGCSGGNLRLIGTNTGTMLREVTHGPWGAEGSSGADFFCIDSRVACAHEPVLG